MQPPPTMRSDTVKRGFERTPHRSLLKATGAIRSDDDFDKPFIGICNSYVDLIPGHVHLQAFGAVANFVTSASQGAVLRVPGAAPAAGDGQQAVEKPNGRQQHSYAIL